MWHHADPFNKWEAGQRLAKKILVKLYGAAASGKASPTILFPFEHLSVLHCYFTNPSLNHNKLCARSSLSSKQHPQASVVSCILTVCRKHDLVPTTCNFSEGQVVMFWEDAEGACTMTVSGVEHST